MNVRSLRSRLLLSSSVLLAASIVATLAWVGFQGNRLVSERLASDLTRAAQLIDTAQAERYASLRITAELLAAFPELNALSQTDAATIRDFLLDYQRRTQRADLLVLLTPQGEVQARTDAVSATAIADVQTRWIVPTLSGRPPSSILETETGTYLATAAAAEAAGNVFGFLLVGSRVDDALAQRLREMTGEETVVLGSTGVLGSTLAANTLPWRSSRDWATSTAASLADVDIAGERYAVRAARATEGDDIVFVNLQSRDRALAPYRQIQVGLILVGVVGVVLGIAASALLARQVSAPVAKLVDGTRQVATGNFDYTIEPSGIEELGVLARSFNDMTRGLRERADMQQFMSQSTVEMIRADRHAPASAGERKVLTVLFADIRGFTSYSESRGPEEVVQMLNTCLGLQADRVKKFGGDVDKFVGDEIVALFNGDDMCLQAIRCAVDIQKGISALGTPIAVGIGIATGEVILGSIGGAGRFDYTAIGLHVNLAARLCSMAKPHEILLAESTWQPVRDLVAAERIEEVSVRGLSQPVAVYRMAIS
ncbi:MAG: adenylate/guanylate cyclase domain-containing protein [Vicinamibacterales bacterium]